MAIIERRELGDVAAGARIHEFPGGPPIGVPFSKPAIVETVGVPMDNSPDHKNLGWRAVRVTTAALDGVLDEKIVYMLTESLANLRPPEPGEGPSGDAIAAATLAGRELEWQRWHDSMGIPDRPGGDDA